VKTAIVHDWLTGMRGGEKCLEQLCGLFPDATVFTLLHVKGSVSPQIERMPIRTSIIQQLPFASTKYRAYLPVMPAAVERFRLSDYDLVLSSSHCVAKGAIASPAACHICYCYTPMRYVWDLTEDYLTAPGVPHLVRPLVSLMFNYLRMWDQLSATRVDYFLAISEHVARRIRRYYGREAEVIYPPVETAAFSRKPERGEYFLIVSALVPYKRIDLAVLAFNALNLPLKVIGLGPEQRRLRALARRNVEFLGWVTQDDLAEYYARCRALVFPGEEDFGIVPLEAQAAGKPVIALGRGGVVETVIPINRQEGLPITRRSGEEAAPTGLFFYEKSPQAIQDAVKGFEKVEASFDPYRIRANASRFDVSVFRERMLKAVHSRLEGWWQ